MLSRQYSIPLGVRRWREQLEAFLRLAEAASSNTVTADQVPFTGETTRLVSDPFQRICVLILSIETFSGVAEISVVHGIRRIKCVCYVTNIQSREGHTEDDNQ